MNNQIVANHDDNNTSMSMTSSFINCGEDQPLFVFTQEIANLDRSNRYKHIECPIGDPRNILDVTQYQHIIYRTLCQKELEIKRNFFIQDELSFLERGIAYDGMSHVHYRLNLSTNGLYIGFGIMDKYFTMHQLPRDKLKLYANAALFIGSKVEDYRPPRVRDFIKMADHCFGGKSFTPRELYEAEHNLMAAIDFSITFGTPLFYLTQLMRISGHTQENILLARYILEIIQTNIKFVGLPYSMQAAVAVMSTRIIEQQPRWTPELAGYTNYTETDIFNLSLSVRDMMLESDCPTTSFIRRKYGTDLFRRVSLVAVPSSWQ